MPVLKRIVATDYTWDEVSGLLNLLSAASGRKIKSEVSITFPQDKVILNSNGTSVFGSYGDRLQTVTEGVLYEDGTCLVCATVSTWGGTFASHDDIRATYYKLTPIAKKTAARMDREIKKGK